MDKKVVAFTLPVPETPSSQEHLQKYLTAYMQGKWDALQTVKDLETKNPEIIDGLKQIMADVSRLRESRPLKG